MRYLYLFLLYLIFPFIWLRLLWRARKAPAYAKHWQERVGRVPFQLNQSSIWIHAVSLGETMAASRLIQKLQTHYPDTPLVITTMTPTGRNQALKYKKENTYVCYVPFDYPFAIKQFFKRVKPKISIVMETELWPNLLFLCDQYHIPFLLMNARLSEKSMRAYSRIASFMKVMLKKVSAVAANSVSEGERFVALGLERNKLYVTGNLKFDLVIPDDLKQKATTIKKQFGKNRLAFIAASTHEGEDEIILNAFLALRHDFPQLLLILVPRHPERFHSVIQRCKQTGLSVLSRSESRSPNEEIAIYVGDTLGELLLFYAMAEVACIGGSFIPTGGHNPLEPAALGLPIVIGPYVFNFTDIVVLLEKAGALMQTTSEALEMTLNSLLEDEKKRIEMGKAGQRVVAENQGALQRQWELLCQWIQKQV